MSVFTLLRGRTRAFRSKIDFCSQALSLDRRQLTHAVSMLGSAECFVVTRPC